MLYRLRSRAYKENEKSLICGFLTFAINSRLYDTEKKRKRKGERERERKGGETEKERVRE